MDSSQIAKFTELLVRDRGRFWLCSYPPLHDSHCPMVNGDGECSCDRKLVELRKRLLEIFYQLMLPEEPPRWLDSSVLPLFPCRPRHAGGRPKKFHAELALRFGLLQTLDGQTQRRALLTCAISLSSIKRWKKRYPWFGEMVRAIWHTRKLCRGSYPRRVLTRSKNAGSGTHQQDSTIATKSLYRPEYATYARSSIRTTAAAIGVSPTTVHRWANRYFMEFGSRIELERGYKQLARLKARIEALAVAHSARKHRA